MIGIAVLTAGKLLGVTVANFIEKRFVSKIYLYNYYLSDKTLLTELEDFAEANELSMSTTTTVFKDIERFTVTDCAVRPSLQERRGMSEANRSLSKCGDIRR